MITQNEWTPAEERTLKNMWEQRCSGTEIAAALNRPRNSVLGKARRMKLERRRDPVVRPDSMKLERRRDPVVRPDSLKINKGVRGGSAFGHSISKKTAAEKQKIADAMQEFDPVFAPLPGTTPVDLIDLGRQQCHWPIGKTIETATQYCGCRATRNQYCETHAAIAFRTKTVTISEKDYVRS